MPLQILPKETNWGEGLGTGLGAGLSQGMQALADLKMQEYAQRQQATRTKSALEQYGIPKEQAQAISQMDPTMQQAYFKNYLQAPQNEAYANAWSQLLGGSQQPSTPQTGIQALITGTQTDVPISSEKKTAQAGAPSFKGLSKEQLEKLGPVALQKQQFERKEAAKTSEQDWKKAQYFDERSKPTYEEAKGKAKIADENQMRFDRMKELIMKGQLPIPAWSNTFDSMAQGILGIGINLKSIMGADTEEFTKLSADMMKNAKEYFGARITDKDLEVFLKTIPTMSNTDEGKLRIIHNLELFDKANKEKYRIMNEIMDGNDGMRPRNFDQILEKRFSPIQKQIADEFKKGVREDYADSPFRPLTKKEKEKVDEAKEIMAIRIQSMQESPL